MQNGNSNLKSLYLNTNGANHTKEPCPVGKETYDDWHDIDWQTVNKNVNRLRARIFRAARQKDFKNLRNLQELILNSSDNFLLSIRKSTTSKGRFTAGIDNKLVITPKQRMELFRELTLEGIKIRRY
jgi:RNA-directed DNA polymerase